MRTVLTAYLILTALAGHARAGGMLVEYADAAPHIKHLRQGRTITLSASRSFMAR